MDTIEHLKEIDYTLYVDGDGPDMAGKLHKTMDNDAVMAFLDEHFRAGEIDDEGELEEGTFEIPITTLDELLEYMTLFKDFKMSLSQSAESIKNGNKLMRYESVLQNEVKNRYYENWNRKGSLKYNLSVINAELTSRIQKAMEVLSAL